MEARANESAEDTEQAVLVVMPIYNDWECAAVVLRRLVDVMRPADAPVRYLVVDDGSSEPAPAAVRQIADVLELRRNLGNQRAIAVALAWIHDERSEDAIVVMDGDGQDDPADVPRLLSRYRDEGGSKVVFAARQRRSESLTFVFFYWAYRLLHAALTGRGVRVGNFSVLPRQALERLIVVPDLWNHYAASVVHTRIAWCSIPTQRAARVAGQSTMGFASLVVHGLSAISVYSEVVGVRVLCATIALVVAAVVALAAVMGVRLFTDLAVPGWTTFTVGLLLVVLTQAVIISLILVVMMLNGRQTSTFLPVRDYGYFVARVLRSGDE